MPLHLGEIFRPSEFKTKLIDYIWRELVIVNDDHKNDAFCSKNYDWVPFFRSLCQKSSKKLTLYISISLHL